jgi:hypothetical protein
MRGRASGDSQPQFRAPLLASERHAMREAVASRWRQGRIDMDTTDPGTDNRNEADARAPAAREPATPRSTTMGSSLIKNTGETLRTAASTGGELVKRLTPKAMDALETGAGLAQKAGRMAKNAAPKALAALEAGTKLAVVQKGGALALKGGKLAAKAIKRNPMLTAAVVVAGAGAALLIRRRRKKAEAEAAGRSTKSLTPTNKRGAAASKTASKKAASKSTTKTAARKAAPRKRATAGTGAATSASKH